MKILMFKNEKIVKIGDLVSVIDDDLKGKISAFKGNLVQIEDEHGFIMKIKKAKSYSTIIIFMTIFLSLQKRKRLPKFLKKIKINRSPSIYILKNWSIILKILNLGKD